MAVRFYATVIGAKQGTFKPEGTQGGLGKGKIPGVDFAYGVETPHDAATGEVSGKRQHQPVIFTKEWGASSPQFYQAAFTNEVLTSVTFEFILVDASGKEVIDHTIKLTNATISEVEQTLQNGQAGGPMVDSRDLQSIFFYFQKIDITSVSGGTEAIDNWQITA
jgi:type VI secretion system secreted protein Hcp